MVDRKLQRSTYWLLPIALFAAQAAWMAQSSALLATRRLRSRFGARCG